MSDEGDDENASSINTGDSESNDINSSTGGEKELSKISTADQIFLETTV